MADNTPIQNSSGAVESIRDIDRSGVKTQVMQIDVGGASGESLATASNPVPVTLKAGTALIGQAASSDETSTLYNGTTALTPLFATIACSSNGANTIVALSSGKRIRVVRMTVIASAVVNIKFQSSVSPTDITGLHYLAANGGWIEPYCPLGVFQTIASEALVLNLSGAVPVGGSLTYVLI